MPAYLAAAASTGGRRPLEDPAPDALRGGARFVAGFVAVFVGLGAFSGRLASLVPAPSQTRVAGLVLVAVGMVGVGLLPAPPVGRLFPATFGPRSPVLLGAAFALAATPCTTPLLGLGLAAAFAGATAAKGALLLAAYAAGLAAALAAVGGAAGGAIATVQAIRRRYALVMHLAGAATVAFGVVLALGSEWQLSVAARHLLDRVGQ